MTHTEEPAVAVALARTVALAQRGDASARDELARSCQRQAYLYALHLLGHPDDAMDVAQDALLRFFSSLGRFDTTRPVRPWLLRIVLNLVRDRARRTRVRRTEPLDPGPEAVVLEPADPDPDPEARAVAREMQLTVWRAVHELSSQHREIVVLRDYLDLAYDEISTTLKIPRGTVMSRLHRARQQLRLGVIERLGAVQGGES